jgi:hypothetical protein
LTQAAEDRVSESITNWVGSEEFGARFTSALRISHQAAVAIIREDASSLPSGVVVEGDVTVDLTPSIAEAVTRSAAEIAGLINLELPGLPASGDTAAQIDWMSRVARTDLANDFGRVVVVTAERLDPLRGVLGWLDRLVWILPVLAGVAGVGAILLSSDRWAAAVRVGLVVVIALLPLALVYNGFERWAGAGLTSPEGVDLVAATFAAGRDDLYRLIGVAMVAAIGLTLLSFWMLYQRARSPKVRHPDS